MALQCARIDESLKSLGFDINACGSYNKVFGQYMNYYELRKEMLKIDDNLNKAYELKNEFRSFIKNTEVNEAEIMFDEILKDFIEAQRKADTGTACAGGCQ